MYIDSLSPRQLFLVRQASFVYRNGTWVSSYQGQLALDIDESYSACLSYPNREDLFVELKYHLEIWENRVRTGGFAAK